MSTVRSSWFLLLSLKCLDIIDLPINPENSSIYGICSWKCRTVSHLACLAFCAISISYDKGWKHIYSVMAFLLSMFFFSILIFWPRRNRLACVAFSLQQRHITSIWFILIDGYHFITTVCFSTMPILISIAINSRFNWVASIILSISFRATSLNYLKWLNGHKYDLINLPTNLFIISNTGSY